MDDTLRSPVEEVATVYRFESWRFTEVRAALIRRDGRLLAVLREWTRTPSGIFPTRKGVSVRPEHVHYLEEAVAALRLAVDKIGQHMADGRPTPDHRAPTAVPPPCAQRRSPQGEGE